MKQRKRSQSIAGVRESCSLRDGRGSATLYVLIASLFFIIIILGIYTNLTSKKQIQEIAQAEIKKRYENTNVSTEEIYQETLDKQDDHPVTAKEVEEMLNQKMLLVYPVGSIYISENGSNPGDFIGGKWEYYGQGKTLVGSGVVADGEFHRVFNEGTTGGEYEHRLTVEEMPSHTHKGLYGGGLGKSRGAAGGEAEYWYTMKIDATGGDKPHNNMQPYIVVNMWKRVE